MTGTINWAAVVNITAVAFVLGFGAAAGVLTFCLVSARAVPALRWLRQQLLAVNRWARRG